MKNYIMVLCAVLLVITIAKAQGPPITVDKPIMLGAKRKIVKTLTEVRNTKNGTLTRIPLMLHYLPTANTLVAVHLPTVVTTDEVNLGDIQLLAKYQIYRKDKTAKTFRVVAKTLQSLPTGKNLGINGISEGQYESYQGIVAGYETIKYGISSEIGFNISPEGEDEELRYKLGFGLPLLKPGYPVKQINLFFEYTNSWFVNTGNYMLLYAQGLQYAVGRLTVEAAIQTPLIEEVLLPNQRDYSLFLGTRYVF